MNLKGAGLFVTGTDTGVGKTVVTCAIAQQLGRSVRVGVCKPLASGCRREGGQLVSDDGLALVRWGSGDWPMELVCPLRFGPATAPAAATDARLDVDAMAASLCTLDEDSDVLLIEGIGGLMVPIDAHDAGRTVLDLIVAVGLPALIVARAGLGTLNHTAMTARLLAEAGCPVAGLVVNGVQSGSGDESIASNCRWLTRMTGLAILATVPWVAADEVAAGDGRIAPAILDAVGQCHWPSVTGCKNFDRTNRIDRIRKGSPGVENLTGTVSMLVRQERTCGANMFDAGNGPDR